MKKFKDLTINDNIYYLILEKEMFPLSISALVGMRVNSDLVIDKYNLYKIELEHFGIMEFCDNDLERSYEIAYCNDNSMMILATEEDGILIKLKELLKQLCES